MPLYPAQDLQSPFGATPQGYPAGYEATPNEARPTFEVVGEQPQGEAQPSTVLRRTEKAAPSLSETIGAAFSLENEMSGAWRRLNDDNQYGPYDPDHNPYDTIRGTELEPFAASFLGSANQKHTDIIAGRIREEFKSRKVIEQSGWTGTAWSVIASLASPTTLLPGGAFYKSYRAGQAALKSAASVGAWNAGAAAIQETALQSQQYTRSLLESGIAVGGSAILGGVLGAGVSGISSRRFIAMSRALDDELRLGQQIAETIAERELGGGVGSRRLDEVAIGGRGGDAGAASTRMPDLESKGAMGVDSVTEWATPNRVFSSPSPVAREVMAQTVDSPRIFTRNEEGFTTAPRGGSIETRAKTQGVAKLGTAIEIAHEQYMKYRFGQAVAVPGMRHMLDRGSGKLSEREFFIEISKAARRNDTHDIPEVAAAARDIRKKVVDPIADAAIKQKLLDADTVAKGRPKTGGGGAAPQSGGPSPQGPGGGLAADPVARAGAEDVLRQFEALSGLKIDEASRKAAVDFLLSDNDAMRQMRSLLGLEGDDIPFALADQASRKARAEFNEIVERLDRGETVTMPPEHVAAHYEKLGPVLDAPWVNKAKVGVISEIRPVGGGLVSISVATRSGDLLKLPNHFVQSQIEGARAFYDSANGFTVFSRLYGVGSVSEKSLIGELRHENVHRLWRSLGVDVRDRLVAHAEKLRVLDYDSRSYFDVVDVPGAAHMDASALEDAYRARFIAAAGEYKALTRYILDKTKSINDANKFIKQLEGADGADSPIVREMLEELTETRSHVKSARARVAAIEADIDAKIGEEAVAHMVEMHYHGLISDADIAPVRADLDRLFGGMRTAEQDAVERMAQNMEVIFAISDRNIGQSMRRDLDSLGYYSKALEAAKGLKQVKGTPEQMLAQLKAAGVKDAEIEATKLKGMFESKPSVTRDEIVKHLEENRVGLKERVYQGPDKTFDYDGLPTGERSPNAAKWSDNSLDPSNPTYRETVLHLPGKTVDEISKRQETISARSAEIADTLANLRANIATEGGLVRRLTPGHARRVEDLTREQENLVREAEALTAEIAAHSSDVRAADNAFYSGHFPEPNIVGHMMTSMTRHQGKPVFTIDQIQSDWGQKLRDGGARDEWKVSNLRKKTEEAKAAYDDIADHASEFTLEHDALVKQYHRDPTRRGTVYEVNSLGNAPGKVGQEAKSIYAKYLDAELEWSRLRAELQTAEQSAPGHPLVNTTDQWTNTTLRRAIRQAAEADADYIAIPSGKTVLSYNPGDEHGMAEFYDKIVPKNLRNLLAKIDSESASPQKIAKLETPTQGLKGEGFALFPLTAKVKRSVMDDGQPMFALGGPKRPESEMTGARPFDEEEYGTIRRNDSSLSFQVLEGTQDVLISDLRTTGAGGQGNARALMEDILRRVDASGRRAVLDPQALNVKTDIERLKRFYASLGFVERPNGMMIRQAQRSSRLVIDPRQLTELIEPYLAASRAAEAAGLGVERDAAGNILSVMREGKRYAVTRDAEGNVTGIAETPLEQGARSFAVQRGEDGAAQGLNDPAMVALQEQANAVRENLTKTLTQAATRMGIKGVKPEMIDALSERIMEAAQKALYEGASPEAAIARTMQEAIDPTGAMQSRIMSAIGGDRKQRAQEQGFDTSKVLYHGTKASFDAFDTSKAASRMEQAVFLTDSPGIASKYSGDTGSVLPVYIRGNLKTVDFGGGTMLGNMPLGRQAAIFDAKAEGFDGVILKNYKDVGGVGDQYVVFDPANIRSVNADFDPSQSGSSNLMSAIGGGRDVDARLPILNIIRNAGGIKGSQELRDFLDKPGTKGHIPGIVNDRNGVPVYTLRERLVEEGWLRQDATPAEVIDLVTEELSKARGTRALINDENDVLNAAFQYHEAQGLPYDLSAVEERLLVRQVKAGVSLENAIERVKTQSGAKASSTDAKPNKTLSDAEQWRARQIMREIEIHMADIKAAEGGGGGDEFSKAIGDRIWDDGSQSYWHRVWDRVKVKAWRPRLVEIITEHFEGGQRRAKSELKTLTDEVAATGKAPSAAVAKDIENLQSFIDMPRQELVMNANKVIDHILGAAEGRMVAELPTGVRGALKARTLRIPDALIEDFLESDMRVVLRHYIGSTVADTEIKRMHGSLTMEEQLAKINEDFQRLAAAAPDEKTRIALQDRRDSDIRDIVAMVDRIRGTYKLPDDPMSWGPRVVRGLKDVNYITKLGGMAIAAISDPFRPMMTHGVTAYFRDGIVPLLHGLRGIKMAGAEVRLAGTALDMTLNSRATQLADVMEDYGRYSKFERGLGWMSDKFGMLTGMNQWNTALKTWSGVIVMNNIIRDSIDVLQGVAKKKQIARLAAANIDAADARTIAEQFAKHGEIVDGVYLANTKAWDADANVANVVDVFRGAVVDDVDKIIVTPGVADKPLWASENVRSLIFQFKSFGFASMERTLIAGLQQRDAGVLMGAMLMIGMGAVSEYLKAKVNQKELPKTNAMWVAAAVDRSGLLGWLPEINHAMEQATGGQLGVAKLTGKELSRYASRNWADSALGPTAGMMKDLFGATSGLSRAIAGKERLRESDLAALRRIIPLNNLFYLSYLFQSLEKSAAQALGAQPSTRRITPGR